MTGPQLALSAEWNIANDIVAHLRQQQDGDVTAALVELRMQLQKIYDSKSSDKDIATCQIGLGLAALGLGEHDITRKLLSNAYKIASGAGFVRNNSIVGMTNIGAFKEGNTMAHDALRRYSGEPTTVHHVVNCLKDALDFDGALTAIDQELKMLTNDVAETARVEHEKEFLRSLAGVAQKYGYASGELTERAEFAVNVLRKNRHNVFVVTLNGQSPSTVTLDLFVDASSEECASMNFEVAEALCAEYGDRTGVEVAPVVVRSYAGNPNAHVTEASQ
ncbi:hypothetical protein [Pandoraea sputorum]